MEIEKFDTVIIGAGVSGINMAYYLKNKQNYIILEAGNSYGGTWANIKYPGMR